MMIQNPILPGFNPDPSLVRAGDDFYIATSSFEWFPGIPLYHSKDLVHWRLVRNLLPTKEYLDLTGVSASKGVWAPGLSYCEKEKRFYLIYSNVYSSNTWMFDVDNFMIWTDDIEGEWSKPVYLNSSGFDPYLFCDDDSKKWLVNKDRDFRTENISHRGIVIQEFDTEKAKLLGDPVVISYGMSERSFAEGANIYKRDGWYYLFLSEGGTGYGHCITVGRSRSVTGPYESSPYNPVITSAAEDFAANEEMHFMMTDRYNPAMVLQKSGHGSLIETPGGEWYMSHLCGRPVMPQLRCVLGRETSIQKMEWLSDGWLKMADGSNLAKDQVPAPDLPSHPFPAEPTRIDFKSDTLPACFCTARNEIKPEWADVSAQKEGLRLRGRNTLTSNFAVSLIARRLTAFKARFNTLVRFEPELYHHLAGITCYYDNQSHYFAYKTCDEKTNEAFLSIYGFLCGEMHDYQIRIEVPRSAPVYLTAEINHAELQFTYSLDGATYLPFGPVLDMTALSDEAGSAGIFTGTFVGVAVQDTHTKKNWAQFDYIEYMTEE